jgi:hypothetical protein
MSLPIQCPYCESDKASNELETHLSQCLVRKAIHAEEAKLDRLLTDDEMDAIREQL